MITAHILSHNLQSFTEFVRQKNLKATKLGVAPINFIIGDSFLKELIVDGSTMKFEFVNISVDETQIKINGFQVIGRIDSIDGDILVSGMSDMKKYRNISMSRCDHCNVPRNRNGLILLSDSDGNEKVVGSTCLVDYTGHTSALSYMKSLSWVMDIQDIIDEQFSSVSKRLESFEIKNLLTVASSVVRREGYVSRALSEKTGRMTTKDSVAYFLNDSKSNYGHDMVDDRDSLMMQSQIAWYENTKHADTDYFHNVTRFMERGYVPLRYIGYVVGLIAFYQNSIKVQSVASEFIGEVGQKKVCMTLTLKKAICMGQYAYNSPTRYIYRFQSGTDVVKYSTTVVYEENIEYVVEATIKDHATYKDTKQTVITRAKIISQKSI